jgi:anti-anti-sigma factor
MHKVRKQDDVAIITLDRRLGQGDGAALAALKQCCADLQRDGCVHIVLDAAGLEHAPSTVLGSIIVLQKRAKSEKGELVIVHPGERLKRILQITKMTTIIRVYDDENEALSALARVCGTQGPGS